MQNMILHADSALFHVLNGMLISPPTDYLFIFLTSIKNTWPIYAVMALYIVLTYKKQGIIALLALVLTVGITDQFSTHVLKPMVNRERPCRQESKIRSLIPCGPGQSFPSTHAINNGCLAMFIGIMFPQMRIWVLVFALLVSYSRIYVGVHYPLDVLGGLAFGAGFGFLTAFMLKRFPMSADQN